MFEAEVKLRVADPDAVRRHLLAAGLTQDAPHDEEDTFFQPPDGDFAQSDEALRLRRARGRMTLTYKGPRLDADAKVRAEHTVHVEDDPTPLLEGLGFRAVARLRKRRQRFRGDGVGVVLDHLEGLGWFVEVEVVGSDAGEAAKALAEHVSVLRLDGEPEPRSYLELALASGAGAVERS